MKSSSIHRHGIALIIVLAFLVLISVVIIAFFTRVQTDLQSATNYAQGVQTRQLADFAANIVQGQISDGTKSFEIPRDPSVAGSQPSGARLAWASQPGLIRTYASDGNPHRTFKLYSARQMVEEPGTDYIPTEKLADEVPEAWPSQPALYTDLNTPILIDDPAGQINGRPLTAIYPILDPLALGQVEGFSLAPTVPGSAAPATVDESYNPMSSSAPGKTGNPAPMPTLWLYVLKNGAIIAPDAGGSGTVAEFKTTSGANKPSKDNPIVGRIAFWTDDESCKLNVNVASEGTFWDRPYANTNSAASPFAEYQLARRIPAANEFQRFPGHPAMTCLSPVLGMVPTSRFPPALTPRPLIRYFSATTISSPESVATARRRGQSTIVPVPSNP